MFIVTCQELFKIFFVSGSRSLIFRPPVLQSRPKREQAMACNLVRKVNFLSCWYYLGGLLISFALPFYAFIIAPLLLFVKHFFKIFLGFCFQRAVLLFLSNQPLFQEIHYLYFCRSPTLFPILYLYYSTCVAVCQEIFSTFFNFFLLFSLSLTFYKYYSKIFIKNQ